MTPTELPTKVCIGCTRDLPLEEFPLRVQGQPSRRGRCRECLADYMAHYRARQRVMRLDRVASALARESKPTAVEQFLAAVMHQFGGPDAFAREWKARYDAVSQRSSGLRAGNMLGAIGRIAEAYDSQRRDRCDQVLVTAKELEREIQQRTLEHVAANPDAVIYAALELGYAVVGPRGRLRRR